MDNKIFYENNSIKVTNKRFMVGDKTFVLSNVTSIDSSKSSVVFFKILGFILIMVGVGNFISAFNASSAIGVIDFYSVGYLFWSVIGILFFLTKVRYSVILKTAGADNNVYSSKNKQEIDKIVEALNQSVASANNNELNDSENSTSIADELRKLTELKNENILTAEEFESQKAILLNRRK